MTEATPRLARLERWMQTVVTHPGGVAAGARSAQARLILPQGAADLDSVVLPSKALGAAERLGIYAHMYYARLSDVMADEYPTVRTILGDEAFRRACRRYIEKNPSTERTLSRFSAGFPAFLARRLPGGGRNQLVVDVAKIERAMEDVFDAPRAEPIAHAELAAIGPAEWEHVRLKMNPALRLLLLRMPANDYMNAIGEGRKPRVPRARASYVVVHRHRFRVLRRPLTREQYRLLKALADGRRLAQAVQAGLPRRLAPEQLAARLGGWFREWAAAGFFTGVARSARRRPS